MKRARIVPVKGVEDQAVRVPFMLAAAEEALRFATEKDATANACYWEGQRDALFSLSRILTRREMYDTENADAPEVDLHQFARGYVELPIPAPKCGTSSD